MLNFNQFKPFRHSVENTGIMRIFSVVFTIAAVRRPLGKPAGRLLEPFCLVVVGTSLHPFRFVVIFDGMFMACLVVAGTNLHPFRLVVIFDGVKKVCLAQALHPIPVSTESDGMKKACLAQVLHPISVSTESDGMTAQKRSNLLHPHMAFS
jgi:hypothetical protein